jgi:DNA-binding MarR family transcriptional regulator
MNLYQRLGFLVLGSRLRRISDSFLSEITRAYQNEGIEFDASWFPVFYLLAENDSLSIKELSEQTEVSHPAASQLITGLKNKGLVTTTTCADDGRKQLVTFTAKGRELLTRVQPVWDAILLSMQEVLSDEPQTRQLLAAITSLEKAFQTTPLSERIDRHLVNTLKLTDHE